MRKVLLIGEGCRYVEQEKLYSFVNTSSIPVLASMSGQDLVPLSNNYFGFVGSNGTRVANRLLYECDHIISLGNRMSFNKQSESFKVICNKKITKVDIDKNELTQKVNSNEEQINMDIENYLNICIEQKLLEPNIDWLNYAHELEKFYQDKDMSNPTSSIGEIMKSFAGSVFVGDAGINEKFVVRAYHKYRKKLNNSRLLIPNTFGLLGHAIPTAIGVHYAQKSGVSKPVIAFVGDQGFQYNLAELEIIKKCNLPIGIVIINNNSSGLIEKIQKSKQYNGCDVNLKNGYTVPDFKKVANAFNFKYCRDVEDFVLNTKDGKQTILNLEISINDCAVPFLPKGSKLDNMSPLLDSPRH